MPNPVMFSNQEALLEGHRRAAWKMEQTQKFFADYKKPDNVKFDFRDMYTLLPFLVDMNGMITESEDMQSEYFLNEIKKIEAAFVGTIDPETGIPDFKAVEPYLRRLYATVATDHNIDWDDPSKIEHLFSSIGAQQTMGTMVEKFTPEFFRMCATAEEMQQIDIASMKSYASVYYFQNKIAKRQPELLSFVIKAPEDYGTRLVYLDLETTKAVAEAIENDSDTIMLDGSASEVGRAHFGRPGEKYTLDEDCVNGPDEWNSDEIALKYLEDLMDIAGKSVFAYTSTKVVSEGLRTDFLFINGKPISDFFAELKMDDTYQSRTKAKATVANILRNAMTDGKSVVSIMRPYPTSDGKVTFKHQNVKVDFDKLNAAERANHNIFRRALDFIGIWKIPLPLVSNKERDAAWEKQVESEEYKAAMKAAEDKFITRFNEEAKKPHKDRTVFDAIPEIKRADKVEEKELGENTLSVPADEKSRIPISLDKNDIDPPAADRVAPPITQSAPEVQPEKKP